VAHDILKSLQGDNHERVLALLQENASIEAEAAINCDRVLESRAKANHERLLGLLQSNAAAHGPQVSGKDSDCTTKSDSVPANTTAHPADGPISIAHERVIIRNIAFAQPEAVLQSDAGHYSQVSGDDPVCTTKSDSIPERTAAHPAAEKEDTWCGEKQAQAKADMILPVQRRADQSIQCTPKNPKAVHFTPKNAKCATSCSPKSATCSTSCRRRQRRSPRHTARSVTRVMTRKTPRNAAASRHIKHGSPTYGAEPPCWPVPQRWRS